jgi:hypothetical protein
MRTLSKQFLLITSLLLLSFPMPFIACDLPPFLRFPLLQVTLAANENRFFASNAIDQNKSVLANQMP